MADVALDQQAGFRRRIEIVAGRGRVSAALEDDFHCMEVLLHHDDTCVLEINAQMHRVPWTTCPGAEEKLRQTFLGMALSDISERVEKRQNCTHLHDLTVLAARHSGVGENVSYDIVVSDPVDGLRNAEIRRNGVCLLKWLEKGFVMQSPAEIRGIRLDKLRDWIDGIDADLREAAKLLQWGNMLANGRVIPLAQQSDATKMPAGCYTFQPERAERAKRVGKILDFSKENGWPLAHFESAF
ncbi:DUF2889 domain-containing protein [Zhongshania aquimaris]|uniref:DUF2889 domain-containing protein n=1 Tax=Zhongshania aquimaris TaxID=2857107 RepID=A0ABS6VWV1_9GAMM|nr:DUF2889 domain-containing protein [Zhongshania aquimaris]MBW2942473.1 DUF2889 domain-containing protein [Zhongshania aquimaris]